MSVNVSLIRWGQRGLKHRIGFDCGVDLPHAPASCQWNRSLNNNAAKQNMRINSEAYTDTEGMLGLLMEGTPVLPEVIQRVLMEGMVNVLMERVSGLRAQVTD